MDFMVLLGGAFVPLVFMLLTLRPQTAERPRRLLWVLPLAFSNIFLALAYLSEHRWGGAGLVCWWGAAIMTLLTGMIIYLVIPRSQR